MAIPQFIRSTVDGYLGCCQLEVIMSSATVNILAHVFGALYILSCWANTEGLQSLSHDIEYN